jgi:hypothetical protein
MPLTVLDRKFERMRRRTIDGMAFWAGSGPKGKACGDCEHLQPRGSIGYGCKQFSRMMDGYQPVNNIPRSTPSCKYFEARHAVQVEGTAGSFSFPELTRRSGRGG